MTQTADSRRWQGLVVAVFVWLLVAFPSVHLIQTDVYGRHSLLGAKSHPDLAVAYLTRVIVGALVLALAGPSLTWLAWRFLRRILPDSRIIFFYGSILGVFAQLGLWRWLSPSFHQLANRPLGAGNFVYSGLVAGLLTGEILRRAQRDVTSPRTEGELRKDFRNAALMVWAVILKVIESVYLAYVAPGRVAVGVHFFMFLSTFIWVPLTCRVLWRLKPHSFLQCLIWSCTAGVLAPALIAVALYVPAIILLYLGMPLFYAMLWGGAALEPGAFWWMRLLYVTPGLTWGIVAAVIRWHYVPLEDNLSADERGPAN